MITAPDGSLAKEFDGYSSNHQAIRIFLISPNLVKMLIYKRDLLKKDHDSA
jgi:hypothetical protein